MLGLFGTGTAAGNASSQNQGRGKHEKNPPWASDNHDHSGEYGARPNLGVASPVESIRVDELVAARQSTTVYVSELPSVSGAGTADDPYTSPSGTAGMREAFERLNEIGGGVIYYPSGFYGDGSTSWEIDLARYDEIGNTNWAIYGDGLESSRIRAGNGDGDGVRIWDSSGTAFFYIEIVGVRFEGETSGYQFVLGREDTNAFNSCWTRFSTGSGDGAGACKLNFLLNSYHFGVHNSGEGTACELWRCQFSGIEGSFSSGGGPIEGSDTGEALRLEEYSFANHFRYINVEATYNGIRIADSRAVYNVFQNAYFANISGTAVIQSFEDDGRFGSDEQGTYFHNPFVAGAVEKIIALRDGTLYVDGSSKKWPEYTVQWYQGEQFGGRITDANHVGLDPRSSQPAHSPGRVALSDGDDWDPDNDGTAELVISNGSEWLEIRDLETAF